MKKDPWDFEGEYDISPFYKWSRKKQEKIAPTHISTMDVIYKETELPSLDEENLQYNIVNQFKLLLTLHRNQLAKTSQRALKILSLLENIFNGHATAQVFMYLCMKGATTAWVLQNDLNISEATAYRVLKELRSLGFLNPSIKMMKNKKSKGGPRPTLWSIVGSNKTDIADAAKLHYRLLSPKYRLAEDLAQTILEEYLIPRKIKEISYKEIVIEVKKLKIPFRTPDIASLTAQYLHEQGIRVWRAR